MRRVSRTDAARDLERDVVSDAHTTRDDLRAKGTVAGTLQIDDMDEWRGGRHDSCHERLKRLAEEHAFEVPLFETDGVVTEEVESGDHLHSSVLAC